MLASILTPFWRFFFRKFSNVVPGGTHVKKNEVFCWSSSEKLRHLYKCSRHAFCSSSNFKLNAPTPSLCNRFYLAEMRFWNGHFDLFSKVARSEKIQKVSKVNPSMKMKKIKISKNKSCYLGAGEHFDFSKFFSMVRNFFDTFWKFSKKSQKKSQK